MSTLKVNEIIDSNGDNTTTVNGIPLRPGILDPENRIINGAFDFWQRGTSFTASDYGADRWLNAAVGGTVTMSRQAFVPGDTVGGNNFGSALRQTVSGQTLASHAANVTQRIESARTYAGQTITVLGWARRSSGSGNMVADGFQYFGTGGSPSATISLTPVSIALSESWQPFAAVLAVPSVTGKTIGTNNDDSLGIRFWTSAGSDYNSSTNSLGLQTIGVDFVGIHIKVGTHTVDAVGLYRRPEPASELARCQRYYQEVGQSASNEFVFTTYFGGASNTHYLPVPLPVEMRATPAAAVVGTWTLSNISAFTVTASRKAFRMNVTSISFGAGTVQNVNAGTKLTFDAEL